MKQESICQSFAPWCRQIIMPTTHHTIFYRLNALPDAKPTGQSTEDNASALLAKRKNVHIIRNALQDLDSKFLYSVGLPVR